MGGRAQSDMTSAVGSKFGHTHKDGVRHELAELYFSEVL